MNSMKKNSTFIKFNSTTAILIIVLLIYSALIIGSDQHMRLSADSTLYLDIAEKYLRGEFDDAVNGYWGPLLSWVLIPFLYFGSSHVFAINALNLIVGLFSLVGIWILSFRFQINDSIRNVIMICSLPIMLFYSVVQLFDFLLLCFIIYYLAIVFNDEYPRRAYNGVLCGVLAALAYFSKSYALPFFIVHFLFMNLGHFLRHASRENKIRIVRNTVIGLLTFLIIISPWVVAISSKYGYFTISNIGKGNFANKAPGSPKSGIEFGIPVFYEGFFAPPNETAMSIWEDPSYIWMSRTSWSPLSSLDNLKYFIKHVLKNTFEGLHVLQLFSGLSFVIIIGYTLLLLGQRGRLDRDILNGNLMYPFFTLILYMGGYLPFHYEPRYLWIVNILLLLMGGYIIDGLLQKEFFKCSIRRYLLITFFALSFVIMPAKSFVQARNNINKEMYALGRVLADKYDIQGNIASNRQYVSTNNAWHKTFRLTYWLQNSKYYSQVRESISDDDLKNDLEQNNIDYYFVWGDFFDNAELLSQYKELTESKIPGLRIYSIKEKKMY